ncbi:hypothetical protein LZ575_00800 [Antarcticibacterium sp. 1MA-6-2]|uniref:hypothetical protein n=1 Tax=Antarcticibacterium sp. 1MA-6-2 TaxID=2908210 RepID=UPI001F184968|nr:hypothetical protein [Antarcticibacterium sp. 1MA-6-2]UJH91365.1 hypothetical protein LZ575_00800 [Antarcticibacterium sp. 1MA-6-2]
MRAKIFIENFSWEEELLNLTKKLSAISGLDNIRINPKEASISFEYITEEAMLLVFEKIYPKVFRTSI